MHIHDKREWFKKQKVSRERHLCEQKGLVNTSSQRRMGKLVRDDKRAAVSQIPTCPNKSVQNTISEHTAHPSLEANGLQQEKIHVGRSH